MKNLNAVEEKLRQKAQSELYNLVYNFMQELKKYKGDSYKCFDIHQNKISDTAKSGSEFKSIVLGSNPASTIETLLKSAVSEAYLDRLVESKTNELLNKLDLI